MSQQRQLLDTKTLTSEDADLATSDIYKHHIYKAISSSKNVPVGSPCHLCHHDAGCRTLWPCQLEAQFCQNIDSTRVAPSCSMAPCRDTAVPRQLYCINYHIRLITAPRFQSTSGPRVTPSGIRN
ncbi:hypothetical protein J6590_029451 [Homalodisca vitripennis]|nr:hypothetical protein J6590_029451 [Homalodisca vitripennis]